MKIMYGCHLKKDKEGRYVVSFPQFEEAVTEGDTLEEALFNASEVLTLTLEGRMEEGMDVPKPEEGDFKYKICPSTPTQAALLIKFTRGKTSLASLARSLETSWPSVARLENPKHWPTLKQMDKAAKILGKKLVLDLEDRP